MWEEMRHGKTVLQWSSQKESIQKATEWFPKLSWLVEGRGQGEII
jgi:hypothetical protein